VSAEGSVDGVQKRQKRTPSRKFQSILGQRGSFIGPAQWVVAALIGLGWWMREDRWFVPDQGPGYIFGILGLSLMTLLLFYPLRKRLKFTRDWGRITVWYEVHMLFGLIGPLAILYHANFRMGSLNANIALICTLTVASSGIAGRVIYRHIFELLTGRRKTLGDMRQGLETTRSRLVGEGPAAEVLDALKDFEIHILGDGSQGVSAAKNLLVVPWTSRAARRKALRLLRASRSDRSRDATRRAERAVRAYIVAVRSVADFSLYERLFGLWHVAHIPLAFLLYATAIVHVMAVHMY
jgi:hypothetical protein